MLSTLSQKNKTNKKVITFIFIFVFVLLLPACFILAKVFNFEIYENINVILFCLILTTLIIWSLVLFEKSLNYEKTITTQNKEIQKEIEKRESAIYELQDTHQKLSSTSGYLERIIHESTDLITAVDNDYRYISFNNSFKKSMKGYFDVDVEIGGKLDAVLADYPKKLKQAKQFWERTLGGETFTAEQFFTDITGEINIYELRYSPIKDKSGKIIGASQIARNVTEKNLAAEKIKRERDFASTIFDVNKSMILVIDRDGRIVRFNKACEEVSGYKEEEIKGRIIWNVLIPTGDIAKVKQAQRNFDWGEYKQEYINQWITKDEKLKTISWQISTIKDENGTNDFIVASGIDITEKRESEIAQKRMLEILENSTDFISISDLHGQIIYLNAAGKKMLGINDENSNAPVKTRKCHPKWVNEQLRSEAYPNAKKNGTWLGQSALMTLDGDEIPTSQLILVHRNELNEPEYFSSVIRDISQQNKLSQELEVAKETADKNTHISAAFLANMSHEIRTPMNGVIGLAELLLNTELNNEQRDYAETIQRSGDSLLTIINDILDFSKLETGKLNFEHIDFDLHETIESTFDLFTPTITHKNLELCLNIHRNVPSALRGDPGRLRQILVNFIGNAVKFTDEGEIIITVKVIENGSTPTLHFSVKDTGIGISAGALRKLFNPFIQADSSITKRFGGTGLGLAISKQYITKMNGDLGASSEENVGSTFWFTAQFEAQPIENQRTFSDPILEDLRILIIDDNEAFRNNLQSLTKSWGMIADVAPSCKKALKLLNNAAKQGEVFDVILIDSEMTEMNNFTLIEKIRTKPKLRNTKIVLIQTQNNNNVKIEAREDKVQSYITKPIQQTKLFEKLIKMYSPIDREYIDENVTISIDSPISSRNTLKNKGASTMNAETTKNHRILIAEDNLVNQKVILNQVSRLGYEVDLAENGKAALDALQLKEYALILMDCQMPVMDGFTATKRIRQAESKGSKHIPIIAVTAHAIEGDKEKCLSVGMDDYISKPTKQQTLAKAIDFWLHNSTKEIISNKKKVAPIEHVQPIEPDVTNSELENINERLIELADTCGQETVLECIELFIEDTDNLINSLKQSVANYNFSKTAVEAHKLKGSSSNMGATRLPRFSQKLISLAKEEQKSTLTLLLKQVVDEYAFIKNIYLDKQKEYEESSQKLLAIS